MLDLWLLLCVCQTVAFARVIMTLSAIFTCAYPPGYIVAVLG